MSATLNATIGPLDSGFALVPVVFNVVEFDVTSNYHPANGLFNPNVAGNYLVASNVAIQAVGATLVSADMAVRIGTTNVKKFYRNNLQFPTGGYTDVMVGGTVILQAGVADTISVVISVTTTGSTSSWQIVADNRENYFMVAML